MVNTNSIQSKTESLNKSCCYTNVDSLGAHPLSERANGYVDWTPTNTPPGNTYFIPGNTLGSRASEKVNTASKDTKTWKVNRVCFGPKVWGLFMLVHMLVVSRSQFAWWSRSTPTFVHVWHFHGAVEEFPRLDVKPRHPSPDSPLMSLIHL